MHDNKPMIMLMTLVTAILMSVHCLAGVAGDTIPVAATTDFIPDGKGSHPSWDKAPWHALTRIDSTETDYDARFRILHSDEGIYVLMQGKDRRVTSPYRHDFEELYNADVFEVFFHPDPAFPVYFEYEINARGKELVLLIPNKNGQILGWQPWRYEGDRKVVKRTSITKSHGRMTGWTAEMFFPYRLLAPLIKGRPEKGTVWNGNFCRLDYDGGSMVKWSWSPIRRSFHEFAVFRQLRFD
jgi:hypothetical protein